MDPGPAYLLATIVVVLLLILVAYFWYNRSSAWSSFSYTGGQKVAFTVPDGKPVKSLRFRKCVFTTANPSGNTQSWDVTAVLNGMAAAYDVPNREVTLPLGGSKQVPLNPFSFIKAGFNDTETVPTSADSTNWGSVPSAATKLVGDVRVV